MNEIHGTNGPSNLNDVASQRVQRANTARPGGASAKMTRGQDNVGLSSEGRALSQLGSMEPVRTELVNRLSKEIRDPDFDIDAKFSKAMDRMLDEIFG